MKFDLRFNSKLKKMLIYLIALSLLLIIVYASCEPSTPETKLKPLNINNIESVSMHYLDIDSIQLEDWHSILETTSDSTYD